MLFMILMMLHNNSNNNDDYATLSARIEELEEENKLFDEMLSSFS